MTASLNLLTAGRRQTAALSVFLLVQTLGTVFFVGDVIAGSFLGAIVAAYAATLAGLGNRQAAFLAPGSAGG